MTAVEALDRWRAVPDGLQPFNHARDLRTVIALLELGFGGDLEARDRQWLSDLSAMSGAGPFFDWFARFFPRGAFKGFVWYEGGRLVGNASVMQSTGDLWVIANVVTHPDYRRRGIAWRMMVAAIDTARACGARQIQLQVRAGNTPAGRLYEQLGFWRMNTATKLRLYAPAAAIRLGATPRGWSMVRVGSGTRDRAERLLARAGEADRGGPAGPAAQASEPYGLFDRVDDWLQGRTRYAWAASADGEYLGLVAVHAMRRSGPHRLDLVVDPSWQGMVEAPLVDAALITLGRHASLEVEAEIDIRQSSVIETLGAAGFETVRTLDRLALDLVDA